MVEREQLRGQKELKRDFLLRFEEGPINFNPTYKMGTWGSNKEWIKTSIVEREFQVGLTASSTVAVIKW